MMKVSLQTLFLVLASLFCTTAHASNLSISSTSYNSTSLFSSVGDGDTIFIAAQLRTDGSGTCDKYIDLSTKDVVIVIENGGDMRLFSQCWLIINTESELIIESGGALTHASNNRGIVVVDEANGNGLICATGSGNTPNPLYTPPVSCIAGISSASNLTTDTSLLSFTQIISNGGLVGGAVLPVSWMSFSASRVDNKVKLEWHTASELNCSHYVVQRSLEGQVWESIGTLKGKGTTQSISSYFFDDNDPKENIYYRLAQYDYNGKVSYSNVARVVSNKDPDWVRVFPNPSLGDFEVKSEIEGKIAQIDIYDLQGNLIASKSNVVKREARFTLEPGIYLVVILDLDQNRSVKRLIIQ
ncbi:T9SS type A sorting domain-containing protein [bacterium]|nr:T9SS type A sorting domain-containing protein [bacterium]